MKVQVSLNIVLTIELNYPSNGIHLESTFVGRNYSWVFFESTSLICVLYFTLHQLVSEPKFLLEMVIYDVYEELEKPDEREILFINRILDGKFGFSSFEEMEDIYLTSCNNKNDNCDFINNGVTCKNVISLNIFDKLSFEEEDYTHHHNQSFLSKEKDFNGATKILIVSSLLERCYEPSKWQDNVKNNQQTFHFSRERSIFHNNVKIFYLSTTTLIIFGYVLLTFKLLMLLIYLQMLKKQSRLEDELL